MLELALPLESIAPRRTSIATHPFSSGEHPRDFADSADKSVFPSLVHPQLAAATASDAESLFAYVLSLYIARRSRRL